MSTFKIGLKTVHRKVSVTCQCIFEANRGVLCSLSAFQDTVSNSLHVTPSRGICIRVPAHPFSYKTIFIAFELGSWKHGTCQI